MIINVYVQVVMIVMCIVTVASALTSQRMFDKVSWEESEATHSNSKLLVGSSVENSNTYNTAVATLGAFGVGAYALHLMHPSIRGVTKLPVAFLTGLAVVLTVFMVLSGLVSIGTYNEAKRTSAEGDPIHAVDEDAKLKQGRNFGYATIVLGSIIPLLWIGTAVAKKKGYGSVRGGGGGDMSAPGTVFFRL